MKRWSNISTWMYQFAALVLNDVRDGSSINTLGLTLMGLSPGLRIRIMIPSTLDW